MKAYFADFTYIALRRGDEKDEFHGHVPYWVIGLADRSKWSTWYGGALEEIWSAWQRHAARHLSRDRVHRAVRALAIFGTPSQRNEAPVWSSRAYDGIVAHRLPGDATLPEIGVEDLPGDWARRVRWLENEKHDAWERPQDRLARFFAAHRLNEQRRALDRAVPDVGSAAIGERHRL
ncbi:MULTISPECIES: hypothetical protein [unclassified Luteibacter]|uniref:hypothetical protein n=1 Tax=Luteibacter sp. PvP019 TaxID=3156436 RepID=UPI00339B69D6